MTVLSVDKDEATRTMTITASFDEAVERAWQLWADPRLLERWWGPPTYPATVTDHDLSVGGTVRYFMTGPSGDKSAGWWRVLAVSPPTALEFEDGFADDSGAVDESLPVTRTVVTLSPRDADGGGCVMRLVSVFPSPEAMAQLVAMGMEDGLQQAMSQMDGLLAR